MTKTHSNLHAEMEYISATEGSIALVEIIEDSTASPERRAVAQAALDFLNYDGDCDRWS